MLRCSDAKGVTLSANAVKKVALPALAIAAFLEIFASGPTAHAQVDANTLLLLSFNNTLNGTQGEAPASSSGVGFTTGFSPTTGAAATFPAGSLLTYAANGNINSSQGTLEFFVRPNWNGNDNQTHAFLTWGVGGGAVFSKDGANNLRSYFSRFDNEVGVSISVSNWQAGQWHYVAYTWSDTTKILNLYLDGQLANSNTFTRTLPTVSATNFFVGSDNGNDVANAALDELRISDSVRSSSAIAARYASLSAPEPGSLMLMGFAGVPFVIRSRQRKK